MKHCLTIILALTSMTSPSSSQGSSLTSAERDQTLSVIKRPTVPLEDRAVLAVSLHAFDDSRGVEFLGPIIEAKLEEATELANRTPQAFVDLVAALGEFVCAERQPGSRLEKIEPGISKVEPLDLETQAVRSLCRMLARHDPSPDAAEALFLTLTRLLPRLRAPTSKGIAAMGLLSFASANNRERYYRMIPYQAVVEIAECSRADSSDTRRHAIEALGYTDSISERSLSALKSAISRDDTDSLAAAQGLFRLGSAARPCLAALHDRLNRATIAAERFLFEAAAARITQSDEHVATLLMKAARSGDRVVLILTADVAGAMGGRGLAILEVVEASNSKLRESAIDRKIADARRRIEQMNRRKANEASTPAQPLQAEHAGYCHGVVAVLEEVANRELDSLLARIRDGELTDRQRAIVCDEYLNKANSSGLERRLADLPGDILAANFDKLQQQALAARALGYVPISNKTLQVLRDALVNSERWVVVEAAVLAVWRQGEKMHRRSADERAQMVSALGVVKTREQLIATIPDELHRLFLPLYVDLTELRVQGRRTELERELLALLNAEYASMRKTGLMLLYFMGPSGSFAESTVQSIVDADPIPILRAMANSALERMRVN